MGELKSLELLTANSHSIVVFIVLILNCVIIVRDLVLIGYFVLLTRYLSGFISIFLFLDLLMLTILGVYISAPRLSSTFEGIRKLYVFSALIKIFLELAYIQVATNFSLSFYLDWYHIDLYLGIILGVVLIILTFDILIPKLEMRMQEET